MLEKLKTMDLQDTALWVVAFTGVCVLVGLGKLKPEVVEYLIMAIIGRGVSSKKGG